MYGIGMPKLTYPRNFQILKYSLTQIALLLLLATCKPTSGEMMKGRGDSVCPALWWNSIFSLPRCDHVPTVNPDPGRIGQKCF